MSAGCASVIPTLTIISTQGCGSGDPCKTCYDVAEVAFTDHKNFGGDVAAAFDVWNGDDADDADADAISGDDATDAVDDRD